MTPRPMYMQIPVEEYNNMAKKLLDAAAVIIEKDKEIESLKYSVATLDTDIAMKNRWRKVSEELPEDWDCVIAICQDGTYAMPIYSVANGWDIEGKYYRFDEIKYWMPLPEPPEVK